MNDDFDDLDRAIFALPLATPPAGLRESILRSTIYAARERVVVLSMSEIIAIGAVIAVAVWLMGYAVVDRTFGAELTAQLGAFGRGLIMPEILAWLAIGGAIAAIVWQLQFPGRNPRTGRA